jgi:hypothetical protein
VIVKELDRAFFTRVNSHLQSADLLSGRDWDAKFTTRTADITPLNTGVFLGRAISQLCTRTASQMRVRRSRAAGIDTAVRSALRVSSIRQPMSERAQNAI